ncbi:uncharacterized protein LOC142321606 [Lycorma delicatula]|uniref:uncharacterized protein LOC142321606 n=1 Tax=Lycorma delicatula TaxID=130591 RepID=UPI003F510B32
MVAATERTPLRKAEGGGPPYMFMTNPNRLYRKQIHQFQCLICVIFLLLFVTAVTITILQSVENDVIDKNLDNSSVYPLLSQSWPLKDKEVGKWAGGKLNEDSIEKALAEGMMSLSARDELEKKMVGLPPDTPSFKHQKSIKTSTRATYLARTGYMLDVATRNAVNPEVRTGFKESLSSKTVGKTSQLHSPLLPQDICGEEKKEPACVDSPYTNIDGTCNNLNNPFTWGAAMQPFRRALPPDYADGISAPRKAVDGSELPSAREVSIVVHRPEYRGDEKFTVMLAVWGQFLDHDITATALSQGKDGGTISCCDKPLNEIHPECFPVKVGPEDPYFTNITCLEFVRSAPAPTCTLGPREQLNQASSYIDGSVVYGNTEELMSSLRSYNNGELRMTETPDGRTLLPISSDPDDGCNNEVENSKGRYCFASGDPRANENIYLTTLHLIMARQHNSIAGQLAAINPDWDDEKLFQESRKIVAAQMQHVTYNEFLPVILGPKMMEKLELNSEKDGYFKGYDPNINPTVSNNFATAAFRFAHTLLPGMMKLMKNMSNEETVELHKLLFDPYKLYLPGYLDSALKGAMNTTLERLDNYFNKEVTENLFKQPSKPCGLDLVSLNIQRGRDHGLPSYPAWREQCGLSRPSSFDDLKGYIDGDSLARVSSLYKSVDDIDLYTGALSEYPIEGGMLGPTLTCLIGDQFKRLKAGDRFWYETSAQPQAFTNAQLKEIRKSSLASIICNTADAVDVIHSKVMESISSDNLQMPCREIPQPDLTAWFDMYATEQAQSMKTSIFSSSARFGLQVNQAGFTTDDGFTWSGQPPFNIPMSFFNGPSLGSMHILPPSIQWSSVTTVVTPTTLTLSGSYSVVTYAFIKPFNFTKKQSNGKFTFYANLLWNNTDISTVLSNSETLSSLLFFSSRSPTDNVVNDKKIPLEFVLADPTKNVKKSSPADSAIQKITRSSLILIGNYSVDKTLFVWPGNITVTLPLGILYTGSSTINSYLKGSEKLSSTGIKKTTVPKSPAVLPSSTRLELQVTKASITTDEGFTWSNQPPFAIPMSIFNGQTGTTHIIPPSLQWISTSVAVSPTKLTLSGSYTVNSYAFDKTGDFNFSIKQTTGRFTLDADILWNNTDISNALFTGGSFSSLIVFSPRSPKDIIENGELSLGFVLVNPKTNIKKNSSPIDISKKTSSVIVIGNYSVDKTYFLWSGDIIVTLPDSNLLANSAKSNNNVNNNIVKAFAIPDNFPGIPTSARLGLQVIQASIVTGDGLTWTGEPPVNIPLSVFTGPSVGTTHVLPPSVQWTATSVVISPTQLSISGTYSVLSYVFNRPALLNFTVKQSTGQFTLNANILWNNTNLSTVLFNGNSLSSLLVFSPRAAKNLSDETEFSLESMITNPIDSIKMGSASGSSKTLLRSVILVTGNYSVDKTYFFWPGSIFVKLPLINSLSNSAKLNNNVLKTLAKPKSISGIPTSSRLGLQVTHASIVTGDGLTWTGEPPVNIPLSVFTGPSVGTTHVLPPSVQWTATSVVISPTQLSISGTYSVLSYVFNRPALLNFTVKQSTGQFTLNANILWNNTNLSTVLFNGNSLSSLLVFSPRAAKNLSDETEFSLESMITNPIDSIKMGSASGSSKTLLRSVILVTGNYSVDKTYFFWPGSIFVKLPLINSLSNSAKLNNNVLKTLAKPKSISGIPTSSRLGLQVTHASIVTGDGLTWTGEPPVNIPLSVFTGPSVGTTHVLPPSVQWTATSVVISPTQLSISGTYSVLSYVFNRPALLNFTVKQSTGQFTLNANILWNNTNLSTVLFNGNSLSSLLVFSPRAAKNLSDETEFSLKSMMINSIDDIKVGFTGGPPLTPIHTNSSFSSLILVNGNYSADKTQFYWNGQLIISLKNSSGLNPGLKFLRDSVDISTKPPKPTKAPKPPKPIKKSISVTVVSGNIWAGVGDSESTQIWNGDLPIQIKLDDIVDKDSYSPMAQVTWTGSATNTDLEGAFSLPINIINGTQTLIKNLIGNFSVQFQPKWSANMEELVNPTFKYNCRVLFDEFTKKSTFMSSSNQELTEKASDNDPTKCNILLVGVYYKKPFSCKLLPFMCSDDTLFTWNGEAIITFSFPPDSDLPTPPTTPYSTQLKKLSDGFLTTRKIIGRVLSGSLSAGLPGQSQKTLWSGTFPAVISLPVFWAPGGDQLSDDADKVYGHGAIWSGSVFGATLHGTFSLPQYTGKGATSSIRWWNGDISVQVMSLWDTGIGNLITPGLKFYSRIAFRDVRNATDLLQSANPTQIEVNSAYKAPLILLGSYSSDGRMFYWSGSFVLILYNVPDTNL